jgi:hypothetical protein
MQRIFVIKRVYQKKIDTAAPDDKQRLMSEGNHALDQALTDQGLSEVEYNKIMTGARKDPTLHAKLLERLHLPNSTENAPAAQMPSHSSVEVTPDGVRIVRGQVERGTRRPTGPTMWSPN